MDMFVEERKDYVLSDLSIGPLGSGSDFTPFLQHLGVSVLLVYSAGACGVYSQVGQIASMDQSFGGTIYDAPYHYHSIYDSQRWQEIYADPGFVRHVRIPARPVVPRLTGTITMATGRCGEASWLGRAAPRRFHHPPTQHHALFARA